jgi:capsular exopolysaccharide synthesis family protein
MSHIFDALQRAETERSGVELDTFDLPTELLQIAESAAKAHATSAAPDTEAELHEEAKRLVEELVDPSRTLDQFESLPVCLPADSKLVSVVGRDSLAAEKFRFLSVRLRHLQQRRTLKQLLVTSTIPEEGKSMVASNLACTLASRRQQKTLLIEGDLRRPTVQRQFGMGKVPGLSEYLEGVADATIPIYRLEALGIWVMPAGSAPENPLELMQGGKLSPLMDKLKGWFDWIVIDSPPVLPLADTSVWMRLADGILLVARQGKTDREQLKRGLEAIEPSKLLGALLNSSSNAAHNDYYQRYGHETPAPEKIETKKQN